MDYIEELLDSRDAQVKIRTCNMLVELAQHTITETVVFGLTPYPRLVSLLR
jgi:hypothetical protein